MSHDLRELTLQIGDAQRPLWSLGEETNALYELLQERADFLIDPHRDISAGETRSESGLAISPTQAAMCAWEVARTAAFIRGAIQAVQEKHQRLESSGRPVEVLYAGCGPFALLAIPLMSVFTPAQLQFVLLDIHQESIASARRLVEALGFTAYVANYVQGDACRYDLAVGPEPDVILSETMNVCLANEPLVMIARHLLNQCAEAIIVPQQVRVDACLVDESSEFKLVEPNHVGDYPVPDRDRVKLGTVFQLDAEHARRWGVSDRDQLPAAPVTIPTPLEDRYRPMLLTTIKVYGDVILQDYDCSLTIPQPIRPGPELREGDVLQFTYRLGKTPGLVCHLAARQ